MTPSCRGCGAPIHDPNAPDICPVCVVALEKQNLDLKKKLAEAEAKIAAYKEIFGENDARIGVLQDAIRKIGCNPRWDNEGEFSCGNDYPWDCAECPCQDKP